VTLGLAHVCVVRPLPRHSWSCRYRAAPPARRSQMCHPCVRRRAARRNRRAVARGGDLPCRLTCPAPPDLVNRAGGARVALAMAVTMARRAAARAARALQVARRGHDIYMYAHLLRRFSLQGAPYTKNVRARKMCKPWGNALRAQLAIPRVSSDAGAVIRAQYIRSPRWAAQRSSSRRAMGGVRPPGASETLRFRLTLPVSKPHNAGGRCRNAVSWACGRGTGGAPA